MQTAGSVPLQLVRVVPDPHGLLPHPPGFPLLLRHLLVFPQRQVSAPLSLSPQLTDSLPVGSGEIFRLGNSKLYVSEGRGFVKTYPAFCPSILRLWSDNMQYWSAVMCDVRWFLSHWGSGSGWPLYKEPAGQCPAGEGLKNR